MFKDLLSGCGLIAILRGIRSDEAVAIGRTLYSAGFRLIEVPLNSPQPLKSIAALREDLPPDCLIGAGTVRRVDDIRDVCAVGGQLIVMPHSDPLIVRAAVAAGLTCVPGVATLTEAFAAIDNGASALKLFPAEQITPAIVKAWRAVVPREMALLPVGGIRPEHMQAYLEAGVQGFGLGGALYQAGMSNAQLAIHADDFVKTWRSLPAALTQPS